MTMERYMRCSHCQSVYLCLTSGSHGYHTDHADPNYCEGCSAVVKEALAAALVKIPRRFECVWVAADDVTLAQLLGWERENEAERLERGAPRRVCSPLFRMDGPTITATQQAEYVRGRGAFQGRHFMYRYWPGEEAEVEISEELERNLETGATRPWGQMP